jgi:hypothetical protein
MLFSIGAVLHSARRMEALQCDFAIFVRCPNGFSGCTNSNLRKGWATRTLKKGKKRKKDWAAGRSSTGDRAKSVNVQWSRMSRSIFIDAETGRPGIVRRRLGSQKNMARDLVSWPIVIEMYDPQSWMVIAIGLVYGSLAMKTMANVTLSKKQREEILRALKARFEKNMNPIKVWNGLKYKRSWKLVPKNCGRSMKWKELAVNRTLLAMIKRPANTSFLIVQRKARRAAEVFATTVKRWSQGKNINQKITPLLWQLPWVLSF